LNGVAESGLTSVATPGPAVVAEPLLRLRGVHKRRGDHAVLQGLDLEVARGEVFGLLGPNGSGKSTVLHIAAGLLAPDRGSVWFDGQAVDRAASAHIRARLGLCPQQPALYRELHPAENLDFFARLYGLPAAERATRVAALMQRFGLQPHARTPAARLSGGWQQRLNLAVALVHGPELLLLDEPTSAVDVQARHALWTQIDGLRDSGMALLLSTHDLAEAERLCARVGLLHDGRIAHAGTPAMLCAQVPGRAVASLRSDDKAAVHARAAQRGWPVRDWHGALACLLPEAPHAGTLREVVEAFEGVAVSAVSVQPVGLLHAYLELMPQPARALTAPDGN